MQSTPYTLDPRSQHSYRSTGITGDTPVPEPLSSEDWKEKGAATLVRSAADEAGHVTTKIIKKGVKDFNFGQTLGEGSYSTVMAASDRQTLREYAIKVLDKRHIIKENKVKYVHIEKNTLNRLGDHDGIIRLYYTFQDECSLYFVLDFAANGELLSLIKRMGSLNEECTRYYGMQILDAVDYMHSKGVIHRDLKPENILLDYKMRIKITDFGTAKLLDPITQSEQGDPVYPDDVRANSFVGTAEYVSPELLADKAAGKGSDVWAFGCIIYQLIAGRPPFKASNQYQTFQKIVKLQYSYPPGFPFVIRDLCKKILVLNPKRRLMIPQIKAHEFFDSCVWDREHIWKRAPPRLVPFKPSSARIASNPNIAVTNRLGLAMRPGRALSAQSVPTTTNMVSASAAAAALAKPVAKIQPQQPQPIRRGSAGSILVSPLKKSFAEPPPSPSAAKVLLPSSPNGTAKELKQEKSSKSLRKTVATSSTTSTLPPSSSSSTSASKENGDSIPQIPLIAPVPVRPETPHRLELPPLSQLENDWAHLLIHHEERILKVGTVSIHTSSTSTNYEEESDREPNRLAKFFTGTKRKKRTLLVTTAARLLIVGIEDRKLRAEINISSPHMSLREYPFNNKTGLGAFSIESNSKVFFVEDSAGTSQWVAAVMKAKEYYNQATALSANNALAATAAAALAVTGKKPQPTGSHSAPISNGHSLAVESTSSQPKLVDSSTSTFLQKHEARRITRRAR